ncbi:MAG: hypothetical protein ACKVT1_09980 [Dehalococcoidia bacterium]
MAREKCLVTTRAGAPCGWDVDRCPVPAHRRERELARHDVKVEPPPPVAAPQPATTPPPARPFEPPPEVGGRDLVGFGWWLIERVIGGAISTAEAGVLASLMRVLAGLGPGEMDRDSALREAQLRGLVMHGIPPRDAEEWALAESIFDDDALAELHRWEALLEADADDDREPLLFRHRTRNETDPALGVDGEDRL